MSFILDALKKSEAERQRQAGPTLLEVRITRPRRRYPLWAAIVGVLLGINVVALLVFVLHRPAPSPPSTAAEVAAGPGSGSLVPGGPPSGGPPTMAAGAPGAAPGPAPAAALAAAAPGATPAATPATTAAVAAANAAAAAGNTAGVTPASSAAAAPLTDSDTHNPADDEPALPADSTHVRTAAPDNYANLPSISEIGGNVPALQLDLLDYSEQPNERYALINMHRVHEGDVLPEGPRVLAITRDGVALDYHGQNFLLRPGGSAP